MSADDLDPEIRRFVAEVAAGYARHPSLDRLTPAQARDVCEQVRAPWAQGGPEMHGIAERRIATPHGEVRVRAYRPVPGDLQPALVYLHGGGFALFSLDTHDRVMREYAARAGVTVIGVDYALAPEARFPVALEQIVAVIRWLRAHGPELQVDPSRIAVGGDSAGGNLSIGACLTLRDAGEADAIRGMLLIYGGFQNDCSEEAARRYGGPGAVLTRDEIHVFWGDYLCRADDARNPLACPILARLEGLPPAMLTIPECDVLTEQNLQMAERLREAGVAVRAEVYAGATHSFIEAMSISAVANRAISDGANWLRAVLAAR